MSKVAGHNYFSLFTKHRSRVGADHVYDVFVKISFVMQDKDVLVEYYETLSINKQKRLIILLPCGAPFLRKTPKTITIS